MMEYTRECGQTRALVLGRIVGKSAAVEPLVFVYGSLKRGQKHHDQMNGARYIGLAEVPYHRLVLYEGSYPALTPAPGSPEAVSGELYEVSNEHLKRLDAFEEAPHLYQRASVSLADGTKAWAYVIESRLATEYPAVHGQWTGQA